MMGIKRNKVKNHWFNSVKSLLIEKITNNIYIDIVLADPEYLSSSFTVR